MTVSGVNLRGQTAEEQPLVPLVRFNGLSARHGKQLPRGWRGQGLRPIQIWVPDVRPPAFKAEARRQAQAVAQSEYEVEDQTFIDAVSDSENE